MKEIESIIRAYNQIDKSTTQAALATVVRVEGSSYRRTGARMLVLDTGIWIGGISGGCLEGDALKRARAAITRSRASLVTYDTTQNDSHQIGVGLGCQGIIDVLFTPLDYNNLNNPVEVLKTCLHEPFHFRVLLTLTELGGDWNTLKPGEVILYKEPKDLEIFENPILMKEIEETISINLEKGLSTPLKMGSDSLNNLSLFIEILPPDLHLIIWGHQYDVYPLIFLCRDLGWKVSQVSEGFRLDPGIEPYLFRFYEEEDFPVKDLGPRTALLIMSHDYNLDKKHLEKAMNTSIPYIGMLGPKIRAEKIISELRDQGIIYSDQELDRIYSPIGLDIGATSPEEISLSILAEIRAFFSGREGGFLKKRDSTIHDRYKSEVSDI